MLLSFLQKPIFEGIAQEAVSQCMLSLQSAAQTIERNKVVFFQLIVLLKWHVTHLVFVL